MTKEISGEVVYQRALVSYMDILGFKNLILTASPAEILKILESKDSFDHARTMYGEVTHTKTFSFSDLIVNVTPMRKEKPLHLIFEILRRIGFVQFLLAIKNIFVRGGITIGDIYAADRVIFGPAMIKAYELESHAAKWPIIVIDADMVTYIEEEIPQYLKMRRKAEGSFGVVASQMFLHEFLGLLRKTDEGVTFLDYIACFAYEDLTTGDLDYYLADHKNSVIRAYRKHRHWKYDFIAKYHDDECKAHFPNRPDLKIGVLTDHIRNEFEDI